MMANEGFINPPIRFGSISAVISGCRPSFFSYYKKEQKALQGLVGILKSDGTRFAGFSQEVN
jgi:hypothetical protein